MASFPVAVQRARRLAGRAIRKVYPEFREPRTYPVDEVDVFYCDEAVANAVRSRLAKGAPIGSFDGARSVRIPHPCKPDYELKIKGAGLWGKSVQFGVQRRSGPAAPVFDFEGRAMIDVASGHDAAFLGGASFQQAATEYAMARRLADLGYRVVSCPGYGRLKSGKHLSWFSIHEFHREWIDFTPPSISPTDYFDAIRYRGAVTTALAVQNDLHGYISFVASTDGPRFLKDLHPFRVANPMNMSQLSWTMQLFFSLHIISNTAVAFAKSHIGHEYPPEIQVAPFQGILPTARVADHDALKWTLVAPYMLSTPKRFDVAELADLLKRNPLTSAILEACPSAYVRF
jgi:hypothetical protein